jgi:phosphatidylinositol glycan class M
MPAALDFLFRPVPLYTAAALLRLGLLLHGLRQDATSAVKYTDVDYLVFTDAARLVAHGQSPYGRETYRYTPLLAWLLVPTAWHQPGSAWFFAFGKVVFAAADLLAGYLLERVLLLRRGQHGPGRAGGMGMGMKGSTARRFAALWLLNPMVAVISTRGSSEGMLGVLVVALLWAVLERRVALAGVLLGLGVHFKIYPFIYAPAIVWWMDDDRLGKMRLGGGGSATANDVVLAAKAFLTPERVKFALVSFSTFTALSVLMLSM